MSIESRRRQVHFVEGMSFNPGSSSSVEDKNLFVPEEQAERRIELETEVASDNVLVAIYTMIEEDHGVGQLLRDELQQDPQKRVSYAAYRIPHPQEAVMTLRFHVHPRVDPRAVLDDAIARCIDKIKRLAMALA